MSKLFVDEIVHQSSQGSGTITLGASGETINIPSGSTINLSNSTVTLNSNMKNTPAFFVRKSGNQSFGDQANTKITFETVRLDTDSGFDNTTDYDYTIPTGKDGKYLFFFNVQVSSATASQARELQVRLRQNGVNRFHGSDKPYINDATRVTMSGSIIEDCAAGDVFDLYAQMDTGSGNVSVEAYTAGTSFGAYRIIGA